ncbi:MAG: small conductance mechanosensitive channel, partial [Paraglaciecola sp.]
MEKYMFEFDAEKVSEMIDVYVIPWGINIVMAVLIYIVGKIIVSVLLNVFGKVMARSKYDDMLIDFVKAILN